MAPRPGADRARAVPPVLAVLDYAGRAMATHSTIVYAGVRPAEDAPGAIREAGWKAWHAGPWTHYERGGRTVAVGQLDDAGDDQPLFTTTTDPADVVQRLQAFGQATGYTWLGTCATTALGALRLTWANVAGKPLWHHACPIDNPGSGAIIWDRKPSAREAEQPAWSWDVNGMYLAAAGGADVAYSTLEHTPHAGFDPRLPGYWLVSVPVVSPWEPPLVAPDDLDRHGRAWLTTEAVKALRQRYGPRGALAQMHDSYTAAPLDGRVSCRVGRRWSDRFAQARTTHGSTLIGPAIKRTYAAAAGGMRRESMRVFRPDWSHTWIDLANANMLRRLWRVYDALGVWPTRINTDEVTYRYPADRVHLLEQQLGVSDQLGSFKRSGGAW
jgi:hypothetical protein